MKRLKAYIMVVFGFSRSEARAFMVLLPLMFVIIFSEPVYEAWFVSQEHNHFDDAGKLDSLIATFRFPEEKNPETKEAAFFHFNPNTVTKKEMDSLGIPDHVSGRIERYRNNGGTFKIRRDLSKMYGLDSALFVKLEPFITLPEFLPKKSQPGPTTASHYTKPEAKPPQRFDLNAADTTMFATVYGIGPSLARRIVAYRERLGGFVSADQLYEVWGLDTIVVQRTLQRSEILQDFIPKRININTAHENELSGHPYMKPKMARIIVAYRFQHGNFASIAHLKEINLIDSKTFERIKPYLTLE